MMKPLFAEGNDFNGHSYCVVERSYTGLGAYMNQTLIFKENKTYKITKMSQYSYSEIYQQIGPKKQELKEMSYQMFPYKKNAKESLLVSLLNQESKKKLPKEALKEIEFMRKEILKYKSEFPCAYKVKAMFDRSTLMD